ncbi:unnamed protein product [Gongylonema pulchrum]|uniref:Cilia- and flagella-associated protein 36 n=1 Tax=Gongylonema pulchrum TaxID=637853 RepID=A0A183DSG5_9BILA|nr:unnamed protein product [Gongylonema pulchrum]
MAIINVVTGYPALLPGSVSEQLGEKLEDKLSIEAAFAHSFISIHGRLFAVLEDRKFKIFDELKELRSDYTERFGNYEADKSLSREDWDEISALNATISEAESFELEIDEGNAKQRYLCLLVQLAFVEFQNMNTSTDVANLSTTVSEERFSLFQKIKRKESELQSEQDRFKFSFIPGEYTEELRAQFHETLLSDIENAPCRTVSNEKSPTALMTSSNVNLPDVDLSAKRRRF